MFDTRLVVGDLIALCLHRRVKLPNSQHRIDLRLQNDPIVWLYKKVVSATFDARGKRLLIGHRGQEDHGYETVSTFSFDNAGRFIAIHHWHHDVHQHQVGLLFSEDFSGLLAVTGLEDLITFFF